VLTIIKVHSYYDSLAYITILWYLYLFQVRFQHIFLYVMDI